MRNTALEALLPYSLDELKAAAWANATEIDGSQDRKDCDGFVMRWSEYGALSDHGWEIEHIVPLRHGGFDNPDNVRARRRREHKSAGGSLATALLSIGRKTG